MKTAKKEPALKWTRPDQDTALGDAFSVVAVCAKNGMPCPIHVDMHRGRVSRFTIRDVRVQRDIWAEDDYAHGHGNSTVWGWIKVPRSEHIPPQIRILPDGSALMDDHAQRYYCPPTYELTFFANVPEAHRGRLAEKLPALISRQTAGALEKRTVSVLVSAGVIDDHRYCAVADADQESTEAYQRLLADADLICVLDYGDTLDGVDPSIGLGEIAVIGNPSPPP